MYEYSSRRFNFSQYISCASCTIRIETAAARTLATDKELAENGGWVTVDDGEQQRRLRYVWRQTRAEVMVVVPVPPGTGARDVVDVSLRTKPDTVAEGVADLIRVVIKRKHVGGGDADSGDGGGDRARSDNSLIVLEGELSFQAKLTSGDEEVDWEIKDFPGTRVARDRRLGEPSAAEAGAAAERIEADTVVAESTGGGTESCPGRRGIEVTLRKHCPIPNAVVWWRSLLKGDPEIDISSINGRAKNNSHQSAWEEAMGMFKEKMAERKQRGKISVDTGDN